MDEIIIALLLILGNYTPAEYHLARAIVGERPDLVSPDPVLAERVGQVVLNRLDAGWCSSLTECIATGFWGAATVKGIPPPWALKAARQVLQRGEITGDFYVFSAEDCEKLGLHFQDANYWQCNREWCLAFYGRHTTW